MAIQVPIIIAAGVIAGAGGFAGMIHGGAKVKKMSGEIKAINEEHEKNLKKLEDSNKMTAASMDRLGMLELEACESFDKFSRAFGRVKNRPEFNLGELAELSIQPYTVEELEKVSIGAGVLIGAVGGAGAGVAGGFAAAGAAEAAVVAFGIASTGTPIAALSGQAAVNATLAALGGGAIAYGGGGMALGTIVLGITAAGVGILVGGVLFEVATRILSNKAEAAREEKDKAARSIDEICKYADQLRKASENYRESFSAVYDVYRSYLSRFMQMVYVDGITNWECYTDSDKLVVENLVLLVSVLFHMCKINLVIESTDKQGLNSVNQEDVDRGIEKMNRLMTSKGWGVDDSLSTEGA